LHDTKTKNTRAHTQHFAEASGFPNVTADTDQRRCQTWNSDIPEVGRQTLTNADDKESNAKTILQLSTVQSRTHTVVTSPLKHKRPDNRGGVSDHGNESLLFD
jgi:hypothetical protein